MLSFLLQNPHTLAKIHCNKCYSNVACFRNLVIFMSGTMSTLDSGGFRALNRQQHHFHPILHLSKLPYQQQRSASCPRTTISAFWHTIKRCQTRVFLYTVCVLAVSTSNIILKRTHLAEKRGPGPGSETLKRGWLASGYVDEHKRNGNMIRKAVGRHARGREGGLKLCWFSLGNLGARRRWDFSTQVSGSVGLLSKKPWQPASAQRCTGAIR